MLFANPNGSWFDRRDSRAKIFWVFIISGVAMVIPTLIEMGLLITNFIPVWILASRTHFMIANTIKMLMFLGFLLGISVTVRLVQPMLVGLVIVTLVPLWILSAHLSSKGKVVDTVLKLTGCALGISVLYILIQNQLLTPTILENSILDVLRFYATVSAATLLFQSTDFAELTSALRGFKLSRLPESWKAKIEAIAFYSGMTYSFVPLFAAEIKTMMLVQRARGLGVTEGGPIEQAKKMMGMAIPLFLQSNKIMIDSEVAKTNYGYDPHLPRTQFRTSHFTGEDWLAILASIITAVLFLC